MALFSLSHSGASGSAGSVPDLLVDSAVTPPTESKPVQIRFCPPRAATFDEHWTFLWLPRRGESIVRDDGERYVIVEIDWSADGEPFLIAYHHNRRRAWEVLHGANG